MKKLKIKLIPLIPLIPMLAILSFVIIKKPKGINLDTIRAAGPTLSSISSALTSGGVDQTTITLTENSSTNVYVHGTATHGNGCDSITTTNGTWSGQVFRTNVTGSSSCSADNNDCYQFTESSFTTSGCTGAGDTDLTYELLAPIYYWADPTDSGTHVATNWTSRVVVTDSGSNSTNITDTFEIASLISLDVTSSLDYGTVALGGDSAQKTITFTNTGNTAMDADFIAGSDMTCTTSGSISASNVHISLTNGFTYGTGDQAFSTTTTSTLDLSIPQRTSEVTPETKNAYLILRMPSSAVGGTCSNTITFTAKAN